MASIVISSPANPTIKELVKLKDRKGERSSRSFLVEGAREISRALDMKFIIEDFFYCPRLIGAQSQLLVQRLSGGRTASVSEDIFDKIATRSGSDGVLAVFAQEQYTLDDVARRASKISPFIVVMENVEKPGNLGAVLRTADGCGVHGVVVLGSKVDVWNPNVIRASLGGVFSVPTVSCSESDFFEWCKQLKIKTVAAVLSERSSSIFSADLKGPVALVFGSEAHGLSEGVARVCDQLAMIPMTGICDSLNVSVAAGIFMYEAHRQRLVR